jgi:formate/nitrite transporter
MNDAPSPFDTNPSQFLDAYAPARIAAMVEAAGVRKAGLTSLQMLTLGILAGAFIALGGMFYTLVMTGNPFGFGPARMLGGIAFSLGLILVVVGGAELFTGNNLIVMAWADKKVTTAALLHNWVLVYIGNFIGSVATAVIAAKSGSLDIGGSAVAQTAIKIAQGKVALDPMQAFLRGILCNALVCLAVWLTFAAHHVMGKIMAIIFPIAAFVALGFEHCIANMYLIPVAMMAGAEGVTVSGFIANLVPVTLGNIVGGSVFVALVYWLIYLREGKQ